MHTLHMMAHDEVRPPGDTLNRWVDQVMGKNYHRYCPGESWAPAVNLYEDDQQYCLVVDLAGVEADLIDVQVSNRVLMLSGERPTPQLPEQGGTLKMHLMEIDHGRFCRALELPEDVDAEAIKAASYKGGYLWVLLPKKAR